MDKSTSKKPASKAHVGNVMRGRRVAQKAIRIQLGRSQSANDMIDAMPSICHKVADEIIVSSLMFDICTRAEREANHFLDIVDKEMNW